jgi:hypothetical protein
VNSPVYGVGSGFVNSIDRILLEIIIVTVIDPIIGRSEELVLLKEMLIVSLMMSAGLQGSLCDDLACSTSRLCERTSHGKA